MTTTKRDPHNQSFRSIISTPAKSVADEMLLLELAALKARANIQSSLRQSCNYLADLQARLKALKV
jgi:hypothetical protein